MSRKLLPAFLVAFLLLCQSTFCQEKAVSGKITDEKGDPVPFASVTLKSRPKVGTTADAFGFFSIRVKQGEILEIRAVGFQNGSMTVGAESGMSIMLKASENTVLKEVVITSAFDTKRSLRSSSINAATVSGEQINTTRQLNLNNALAGKVAGVQVQSQAAGKLGAETAVRLRGENGITGPSTALYVVNGTQINSANDINPDDIESMSILAGPAAASLFGPAGANGAIVITTKRGKRGEKGIGVTFNSGVVIDKVYKLPDYQNSYAGGASSTLMLFTWKPGMPQEWKTLDGKYYPDYTDDASWGPAMQGQEYIPWYAWYPGTKYSGKTASLTPQPNNARQFYNTGTTLNNNLSFSKVSDNVSFRMSYSNIHQKGTNYNSSLDKNTLTTSTVIDVTSQLSVAANINYITQSVFGEFSDAYSNNSSGNFNSWFHRDLDFTIMRELKDLRSPQGFLASWNHSNPSSYSLTNSASQANWFKGNYWYNPFSYFDNVNNVNRRDRLYGDVSLTYKISSDWKVKGTFRKNQLTTYTENKTGSILEQSGTQTGIKASYATQNSFDNRENFEGLVSYNKKVREFTFSGNIGFDIYRRYANQIAANTNGGFNVDNLFALSNSKNAITYTNARVANKYRAGFVTGNIGYKNLLFGDFTLRKDYYSELPPGNNSVFIKSFGGSFVFSDLLKTDKKYFSFGKVRLSWGEVPTSLNAYDYPGFNYGVAAVQYNGNFLMTTPNVLVDAGIHGAVNTAREVGADLRFLNNRVGLNLTYWDQTSSGFPITTSVTPATGFNGYLTNVGQVTKNGMDISLNLKPLVKKDLTWDVTLNFSRILQDRIVSLGDPSVTQLNYVPPGGAAQAFAGRYVPTLVQAVGQDWGQLFGYRRKTINGVPVLTTAGLWVREDAPTYLGSVLPDYTGGLQNALTYKNFSLNINIDFQKGGKFASLSDFWGTFSGLTARTAVMNDRGKNIRDDVSTGGGVHVFGVDGTTAKPVDYYVDAQTYFQQTYSSRIQDNNIYDLTFIKLREISLGYDFNLKKTGFAKNIQSARLSLTGTNLWLIYSQTKDFDPAEVSNVFGENSQWPGTRSLGVNLKVVF
jgi:TonB-linked SusC/RagA family outer membrane protein